MDLGMRCSDCIAIVDELINCEGCIRIICRSCYAQKHLHDLYCQRFTDSVNGVK